MSPHGVGWTWNQLEAVSQALSGEETKESTWSRSDIRVEGHSVIDESIVDNAVRCSCMLSYVSRYMLTGMLQPCVSKLWDPTSLDMVSAVFSVPLPTQSDTENSCLELHHCTAIWLLCRMMLQFTDCHTPSMIWNQLSWMDLKKCV